MYIYDRGKEREGIKRQRSRRDAIVGAREEERSVSRTTKRAEKHKSQATGARHVVCIGEVRITGTRSLPKDGAKAPCYVLPLTVYRLPSVLTLSFSFSPVSTGISFFQGCANFGR